jgi:hypothetical protein
VHLADESGADQADSDHRKSLLSSRREQAGPPRFYRIAATLEALSNYVNRIVDNLGDRRIGLRMPLEGEAFLKEEEKS